MPLKHLKMIAILSILFWVSMSVHIYWTFSTPLPADERIRAFAEKYRVTSSVHLLAFMLAGIALSVWAWLRRSAFAAAAMACLMGAALWWMYLAGSSIYFRPPLGDGTFGKALHSWLHIQSSQLPWHLCKLVFLVSAVPAWLFVFTKLSAERREEPPS